MTKKKIPTIELGITGLERYGGYVFDEFITKLRHQEGIKLYSQMANNDPVIGAILFAINMLIRQVDWHVAPMDNSQESAKAAVFLESCINDMEKPWTEVITEIISFIKYGWSWHEIVYKQRAGDNSDLTKNSKYNDGKIGWRKIPGRAQTSWHEWVFSDNGDIEAMVQRAAPDFRSRVIPITKSLLFRTTTAKNNPEGKSVLRTAYRSWYFKKHIEQIQGIGIERDLAGLPVAYVPADILDPNANASRKAILAQIKKIITNIRRDEQEGVVFPKVLDDNGKDLYELKLMSTGGSRQFNTKEIMEYYDQRIAMTVLADFILLGHGKTGSFALSTSKTKVFTFAISSFVDIIQAAFNRFAVPELFKLNGVVLNKYPQIIASEVEHINLDELGKFIKNLSGSGAVLFPDDALENDLRTKANLPVKNAKGIM